jgi:phage gp16-like protein
MSAADTRSDPRIVRGRRNSEIAAIHVGKTRLGLDDETYRDFLFALTRHRSAAELDEPARRKVIEAMRRAGFKQTRSVEKTMRAAGRQPQLAMIRVLWKELKFLGALGRDASERRLAGFAKRITGIDRLEWTPAADLRKVIEGLKAWRDRVGARADG